MSITYGFAGVRYGGTAEGNLTYPCFGFQDTNTSAALGTYEEIGGIKTYVATPKVDYPKNKAVIYLTDVFGLEFPNNLVRRPPFYCSELTNPIQLLADDFARNGFKVYAPELFEGDPVAPDAFTTVCHSL